MNFPLNNLRFQTPTDDMSPLMKLYEAIGKAQSEFIPLPKLKEGQAGNQKFKYADYKTIIKCIQKSLKDNGVTIVQPFHTENEKPAVTLIVSGHGAAIASTFTFEMSPKVQDFGKDSTYYRRYQLQAFFCLEGDKDADDPDDLVETVTKSVQVVVSKPVESAAIPKAVSPDSAKATVPEAKPASETQAKPSVGPESLRSPNELLMDAKKQLKWEMKDFDTFCQENAESFPNFVSATKLSGDDKIKLFKLLVEKKSVIPF